MNASGSFDFWGSGHFPSGDERSWPKDALSAWLAAADEGFSSGMGWTWKATESGMSRGKLLHAVTQRLDDLYRNYEPCYQADISDLNLAELPPWSPVLSEIKELRGIPGMRVAGPLERNFNSAMAPHERAWTMGVELPCGRHPLDDLRQDALCITQAFDRDPQLCCIAQDADQTEACMLSIRDIRLLLPAGWLGPGCAVMVVQPTAMAQVQQVDPFSNWCGTEGEVVEVRPGRRALVRMLTSASDAQPAPVVEIPCSRLIICKKQPSLKKKSSTQQGPGNERTGDAAAGGSTTGADTTATATDAFLHTDSWVVLRGLSKRPELNGAVGVVVQAGSGDDGGSDGAGARVGVQLVPWNRPLASTPITQVATPALNSIVMRVQRSNLVAVKQPPAVAVLAYSGQTAGTKDVGRFMSSEASKVFLTGHGAQNIKCTLREIRCFKKTLEATTRVMAPLSAAERSQVLGNLDPKWWKVVVVTPTEPPAAPADMARQALRAAMACRHCQARGVKLMSCKGCSAVSYCSRECQVADWKARHKKECAFKKDPNQEQQQQAQAQGDSSRGGAAGTPAVGSSRDGVKTIRLDILNSTDSPKDKLWLLVDSARPICSNKLPKNLYGEAPFIVKVQNSFDMTASFIQGMSDEVMFNGHTMLYDEPKSVSFHVGRGACPEGHAALVRALKTHGVPGSRNPMGRKVYLYAMREGPYLNVTVEGNIPTQQQRW